MKKFTLIEVLVVVAIIGILASMLLPALGKARERSQAAVCINKLKQISLAALMYSEDEDNFAPLNENSDPWAKKLSLNDFLPKIDTDESNNIYKCPKGADINDYWAINYAMNWRLGWDNGVAAQEDWHANLSLDSTHPSATVFFLDAYNNNAIMWKGGLDEDAVYNVAEGFRVARHQNKGNVAFIDGHVEAISAQGLLYMASKNYRDETWEP